MFKTLHESFENPALQDLQNNITRYQNIEPNYVVFTSQNNYQFPNAGVAQKNQLSNVQLQNALTAIGNTVVPLATGGTTQSTAIPGLNNVLTGIPDSLEQRVKACRTNTGLIGLSNLMKSQADPAATERCGWRYKAGIGAIPQVAQAAYGNSAGPLDPGRPTLDKVGDGIQYFWDLEKAEKQMVVDICKAATTCQDMMAVPLSAAGDFSNLCGYCETSQKIIPIRNTNGTITARYTDMDKQCAPEKIITMKDASQRCPPLPADAAQAPFSKCLNTNKLDRDCVVLSALFAGCSPEGTLVASLTKGKNQNDYGDILRNQKSFQVYQQLSSTPLSDDVVRSGNATIFSAFMNNYSLNKNMYDSDNKRRQIAALDLCRNAGEYDSYDFCGDLKDGDRDFELTCMQKYYLKNGGSTQGSEYPTEANYLTLKGNNTWGQYKAIVDSLRSATNSADPMAQANALNRLSGLGIQTPSPTSLGRGEGSQGVEVFYFDTARRTFLGRRPYLSAAGRNLPNFNVGTGVVENTGLADNVMMVYIYDIRPDNQMQLALGVVTDDGWAIGFNQQVFNIRDRSNGASWWYPQGPTWHNTQAFTINAESTKLPNIFMGAWFERGGGAVHHPFYRIGPAVLDKGGPGWVEIGRGNTPDYPIDQFWKNNCYFSQEPDAPSIQIEPYQPKNYFTEGMHFVDRRLWGSDILRETEANRTATQKGHIFSKPVGSRLPSNQFALTLENTRQWSIAGSIAFSAIRTWVVCFNIGMLKKGFNFAYGDLIFMKNNLRGRRDWAVRIYDINTDDFAQISLAYNGPRGLKETIRLQIPQNKWLMCVVRLHPENMSSRSIGKMSMIVQTVDNVLAGNIMGGIQMVEILAGNEGVLFNDISRDRSDAGQLILGTVHPNEQKRFHYAWVHGFDDVMDLNDPTMLKKDATKTWLGRWFD
jgi:hypothetical protein